MDQYGDIAAYYDLEHEDFDEDISFYLNLVALGPVLELGAGTGRISAALADAGHEVWAVDRSEGMLREARRRLGPRTNVHLVHASAEELEACPPFAELRVAILSLNFLWHFPDWDAQLRVLRAVRQQVMHSALVIIDLSNPLAMVDRGARGDVRERHHWTSEDRNVLSYSATWDDAAEQTLTVDLRFDEWSRDGVVHRSTSRFSLRYLYRFELELLLHSAGYTLELLYGSYDLDPYTAESPNMIAVCRAEKE